MPGGCSLCGRTQGITAMIQKLQDSRAVLLGAVAIFALGLTTSGYALGDGLRRSKMAEHRTVTGSIQLRTNDIARVRAAYARQAELLRDGVELVGSGSNISFTFTKLNALKPQMIAEATLNARESAEQFARDSGVSVGKMKTASQGYFSVGPRDGQECDDCSSSGGSTPFQQVRVVTTIDHALA